MAAGPFQRLISGASGLQVPWYLGGHNGGVFLEAFGLTLDSVVESMARGMQLSRPLQCDSSALPYIGQDRKIRRYPSEPEISYRTRCAKWRQIWKRAGSHYGEMLNLQPYFLPGTLPKIRIVHQAGDGSSATWWTRNADGTEEYHQESPSNWNFDGITWKQIGTVTGATNTDPIVVDTTVPNGLIQNQTVKIASVSGNTATNGIWKVTPTSSTTFSIPAIGNGGFSGNGSLSINYWSRWWCIIYLTGTQYDGTTAYDDGSVYDGGQVYDGVPAANIVDIVAILNEFKASHSILWGVIATTDPDSFDPGGTVDTLPDGSTSLPAGNWGSIVDPVTSMPTRPPYASFLYDLGQA